jgi:predicted nucleotidyltransferase
MLNENEKNIIIEIAKRFGAKRVLLFGSSADPQKRGKDIDLAVEGLPAEDFFGFYGELLFSLPLPVDLVDLASKSKFNQMVRREGVAIYG